MSSRGRNYSYSHNAQSRAGASRARGGTYIDGNTVRRVQEIPATRRSASQPAAQPQHRGKTFTQVRRERERRAAASRNMQRALALNRGYVAFLTLATVLCLIACVFFINLQAGISERMSAIASMETAISEQREANDILESKVETGMTLDEVKDRAADLGLVYPSTSQIQYFTVDSDDYMNQYADVASR